MACAWKQAAAGAGVAQSTTFVSFLSSVMGTVLMFKAFGLFAALAIGINYIMGITLVRFLLKCLLNYYEPCDHVIIIILNYVVFAVVSLFDYHLGTVRPSMGIPIRRMAESQ